MGLSLVDILIDADQSPLSTSYPRPCEWKWKKVKKVKKSEKWKSEEWSTFDPLIFFILRYNKKEVLGDDNISIKNCRTTFLWVLSLGLFEGFFICKIEAELK